jgi:NTP pyrophosphatase (non-canonical NTP hydrolase)
MTTLKIIRAIDPMTFKPKIVIIDGGYELIEFDLELQVNNSLTHNKKEAITNLKNRIKDKLNVSRHFEVDELIDNEYNSRGMTINEYQNKAIKTAIYGVGNSIIYPTLGLAGEAGEVADKVKKVLRDSNGEFSDEVKKQIIFESGDVLWYLAALARDLGYTLEEMAQMNLDKLASRKERNQISGSGDNR